MDYIYDFYNNVTAGLPSLLMAILLLIVAFLVSGFARKIVIKLLKHINFQKIADKYGLTKESTKGGLTFVGNLVYFIVFLLFVPAIFAKLGIQSATAPILSMLTLFLNYIPNILAAVIILVIGLFIARIIKQLLIPVLKRLKVDSLQEKAGIETTEHTKFSSVIGNIVYVLILFPIIIAALQVLNIQAVSDPAVNMLDQVFLFLPQLFIALAIIAVGILIASMVEKLLSALLASVGVDTYIGSHCKICNEAPKKVLLSKLIGTIVKYVLILLFAVEAFNILNLAVLNKAGIVILAYLPSIIAAVLIMSLAFMLAQWVEGMIRNKMPNSPIFAISVKAIILIFAVIMTLSQLGIATDIVNAAFIIVLSAIAVAFAIAFGIGGRDYASRTLKHFEKKDEE